MSEILDEYKTLKTEGEGYYTEKRSKFLAFAHHVSTVEEIKDLIAGYRIRRGAIDHNIPLMTNVRLAKAFIEAFTAMNLDDVKIKSWQEYNN